MNLNSFKTANTPIYSVSELAAIIKNMLEDNFTYIQIKGEISGLKIHSSGHIYFNLKDESSLINAVCFKNYAKTLKLNPEDGIEVVLTGKLTSYSARSNYQILVTNLELAGQGALMELFEKRKKLLAQEGLFSAEHKKPIVKIPKKIAVITSETGAVFHDICHRIEARFPLEIILYPSKVQGKGAEITIANAIQHLNELSEKPDVIILARGGGSIEDLWCFNEEIVVRAIFASKIPLISAIGHETDTSLADLAADLRAPTPTAAAELATPDKNEISQYLDITEARITKNITNLLSSLQQNIKYLTITHPKDSLKIKANQLEILATKLEQQLKNKVDFIQQKLAHLKINKDLLMMQLKYQEQNLLNINKNMFSALNNILTAKERKYNYVTKLLESYSYKKTLKRGFSVVRNKTGKIISSKAAIEFPFKLELSDGIIEIKINN